METTKLLKIPMLFRHAKAQSQPENQIEPKETDALAECRNEKLPDAKLLEWEFEQKKTTNFWHSKWILDDPLNKRQVLEYKSTLSPHVLQRAAKSLWKVFFGFSLNILEIMAGNGCATKILQRELQGCYLSWTATDVQPEFPCLATNATKGDTNIIKCGIDAVAAVEQFGKDHNTLLLVSPPPGNDSYADYYAIELWTKLPNAVFLIFIGELGASDGSEGLYKYLMEHEKWKCIVRETIHVQNDVFGGRLEKEVFTFWKPK